MSVRNTLRANQPDASSVKAAMPFFDRFGRSFPGEIATLIGGETHAREGVRFCEYTQLMTNMPPVESIAFASASAVTVTR